MLNGNWSPPFRYAHNPDQALNRITVESPARLISSSERKTLNRIENIPGHLCGGTQNKKK
jgi:hypothetical protein